MEKTKKELQKTKRTRINEWYNYTEKITLNRWLKLNVNLGVLLFKKIFFAKNLHSIFIKKIFFNLKKWYKFRIATNTSLFFNFGLCSTCYIVG